MVALVNQTSSNSRRRTATTDVFSNRNDCVASDSRLDNSSSSSSSNSINSTLSCKVTKGKNSNSIQLLPMSLALQSKCVQPQSTSTNLFYGTRSSLRNRASSDVSWLSSSDDEDNTDNDAENDILPAIQRSIFECDVLGLDSLSVHSLTSTASSSYTTGRNGCHRCSSNDNSTPLAMYNDFGDNDSYDDDDEDDVDDVSVLYCDGKLNSATALVSKTTATISTTASSNSDNDTTTTYAETSYSRDSSVVSFCTNPPTVFCYDKPEYMYCSDLYYSASEMEQMMDDYIYEQQNENNSNISTIVGKEFRE